MQWEKPQPEVAGSARVQARAGDGWLRHAARDDLPQVVAIYNGTVASRQVTADLQPVSVASRENWFRAHDPDHRPLWVLEVAGAVVAWLSLSDFYGRPAYDATAEVSVYVDASVRRQGFGARLLDHALREAPGLGLGCLLGFVFAHNASSLALFRGRGFGQWGHLPAVARLDGVARDLIIVGRHLEAVQA